MGESCYEATAEAFFWINKLVRFRKWFCNACVIAIISYGETIVKYAYLVVSEKTQAVANPVVY
jgi:hypothetical protein